MTCKCGVFSIQGITYLAQCVECKNNTVHTNHVPTEYKFKWYEFHIWIVRDCPKIRLGIELYCLVAICIWFWCAFLDYFKLVDFTQSSLINKIISGYLILSTILAFGYIDAIGKLACKKFE